MSNVVTWETIQVPHIRLDLPGMMVAWFFAAKFACTRLPFLVPLSWMYSPAWFDPDMMEGREYMRNEKGRKEV